MGRTIPTLGLSIGIILACGSAGRLYAVGRTAAVSGYWTNAATWPATGIPANNDDVTINSGVAVTADVSTASLNSMAVNGTLVFSGWNTAITSTTVTISDTVTHTPQSTTETNPAGPWVPDSRVWIVCSDLTVSSGGKIDVNGKGYRGPTPSGSALVGRGPGGGKVSDWAGGGGYGANGGRAWNKTPGGTNYGSASAPTNPGSSGGSAYDYGAGAKAGNGGGAVRIDASDRVTVDGLISASGDNGPGSSYTSSGGSGGGIYITCRSFTGSGGIIRSMGGSGPIYAGLGPTGGGSGGRVAVVYDVAEQSNAPMPSVSFNVGGGVSGPSLWFEYDGASYGEPGTLYLTDLRFFPANVVTSSFSLLTPNTTNWTVSTFTCSNAWVRFPPGCTMLVSNSLVIGSNAIVELPAPALLTCGSLTLTNGGRLYLSSGPTNGTALAYGGLLSVAGTLSISTGSAVYATCDPTNGGAIKMTVGTLAVRSGGTINAEGRGFRDWIAGNKGRGPGGGLASDVGSGAGYGGAGSGDTRGNAGGITYGSSNAPIDAGSAGGHGSASATGGGYGGGVVRLTVLDRATVDGTISADGWKPVEGVSGFNGYSSGGGSGGSIWIMTPRLFGAGWLKASGGNAGSFSSGTGPGGGGGGRIAVWRTFGVPYSTSVTGGVGFALAGAGTVVWGDVPAVGTIIVLR